MKFALPISVLAIVAVLWALLEQSVSDVLGRCLVLWVILGAVWVTVEIVVRHSPATNAARWLAARLPRETLRYSASRRVFARSRR